MSRTRRSALNFISSISLMAFTMLIGFVTTPMLLKWLGEELYGAYRATLDCYGYLTLLELGLDGALLAILSRVMHQKGIAPEVCRAELRQVIAIGLRAYAYLTSIYMIVGFILVYFIHGLVPVHADHLVDLRWGACVATISFALLPLTSFRAFAEASNRGYHINMLLGLQSVIVTVFSLLFAAWGWKLTGQFIALLIGGCFFHGGVAIYALKLLGKETVPSAPMALQSTVTKELWHLNRPNFIMNLCGKLGLMSDQIIISALLGPAAIVPFFLTCRLPQIAQRVLQSIGNSSWPALVELHAHGEHDRFNERLVELTRTVAILAIAGLLPIVIGNHHFVVLWVGSDHFAGHATSICAAITTYILSLVSLWGWCFTGTGKPHAMLKIFVIQTVINLVLSVIFTAQLGIRGPLLGTAVAQVCTVLWYLPRMLRTTFGTAPLLIAKAYILPALWAIPYGFLVHWVFASIAPFNWFSLAAAMFVAGCSFLLFAAFAMLTAGQRNLWRVRLMSFVWPKRFSP
jgi:O-antigen/teichoic acid export membrane protein